MNKQSHPIQRQRWQCLYEATFNDSQLLSNFKVLYVYVCGDPYSNVQYAAVLTHALSLTVKANTNNFGMVVELPNMSVIFISFNLAMQGCGIVDIADR